MGEGLESLGNPVPFVFREMRRPDDGMQFKGAHHIEYNTLHQLRVFIELPFDLGRIVPHDITPFW